MNHKNDNSPKKRINIYLSENTYEMGKSLAARNNTVFSQMITNWIWQEESLHDEPRLDRSWVKDLDTETMERLLQYCYENHTSPAQAVTDWIWSAKVKGQNIRGQMSLLK